MRVVAVVWEDAAFDEEGTGGDETVLCCTFGVLTDITDEKLVLVSEVNRDSGQTSVRYKHTIPKAYVKRVIPLKSVKGRSADLEPFPPLDHA